MPMTAYYAGQPDAKPVFNDFQTPIGKFIHCFHEKPQPEVDDKTQKPKLDDKGIPLAGFKVTMMWPKSELDTTLIPLRQLAAKTRDEAWGPDCANDQWFRLEAFLRDGDNPEHNTKRKDYLMGNTYLNFKTKAVPILGPDGKFTGQYSGKPGIVGPNREDLMPADVYPGAYGRVSGFMFGTEYMGKKFISVRLQNIQKGGGPNGNGDGERMAGAGGRPDAKSQFDPLEPANGGLGSLGGSIVL